MDLSPLRNLTNKGGISADRGNKTTLPLTIPRLSQVVCKGFTPRMKEIVMLGTLTCLVDMQGETNGYATAPGQTWSILKRVNILGKQPRT